MKKAVIIVSVLELVLCSCGGKHNKKADNSALADSLFISKLTKQELITSRYGRFLPDGSSVVELKGNDFDVYYISIPNDYSVNVIRGEDFDVYYFQPTDTTVQAPFTAGVYFGNYPNELKQDSCIIKTQESEILGKNAKWTVSNCNGQYHIQTIIDSQSRWNRNEFLHAFGNANSLGELHKLFVIFRTMRKENDYQRYSDKLRQ